MPAKPFQFFLKEGAFTVGGKTFRVIETPGHSPGSLCLFWEERGVLISGDTVFAMGVGRTDMAGGDPGLLGKSVRDLSRLPVDYLLPGHGDILAGRDMVRRNFEMLLSEFFA